MNDLVSLDNLEYVINQYERLGPIMGVLLPFIESFLPFLPLVVFVIANASAFGLWLGFLLSWLGTVAGSYVVFLLVRRFGKHKRLRRFTQNERVQSLIRWVDIRGLSPLFVLLCFPFTPSVLVNIVAGLSNISKKVYIIILASGKFIMIFSISFLGYDLRSLLTSPTKIIAALIAIAALWGVGKLMEKQLNKRVMRDLQSTDKKSGE